ncbi:MAG: SDR family oxidoreductase [Alphaproteobacteria bacterium]|nr:SDR family oxidoreductase [Alphaproteobacteria bacterium]
MTKSVLITGAAKRIGRQMALDLATDGWDVAVHYDRSAEAAEEVAELIRNMGRRAVVVQGDLAEADVAERLMAAILAGLGPITALINNASIFEVDRVGEITPQSWQRHQDINLRSPVMLAQAFARQLPQSEYGNVINIIDQRVWKLNPRFFSYTVSKSGLWTATQTLAQALAPRIRVNAIGPGPALPSSRMSQDDFAKQESLTLLGRGTSPTEISQTVKFILSQPALTGQMIALDGGQHLVWQTADVVEVQE